MDKYFNIKKSNLSNIYSIVVLYNPINDNIKNLSKISKLSTKLYVIDNSDVVTDLISIDTNNIIYIKNDFNIGLDKALNVGIKKCLADVECTHIALFDQDSIPDNLMFKNMIKYLDKCEDNVVAVSPQIIDIKQTINSTLTDIENVDVVITSGSLYPRNAFEKVGLMDETFFIDYIDYEWCLRAKSKKYKIVRINDAILYHNMGDTFINFFGISKPLHVNKLRHYYIIRNQLIFISRKYIPLKYRLIHFTKLFYRIPAYLFLSNDKISSWKLISKAFFDFFKNRKEYLEIKY
jgi:rhamnosyltransferase